MKRYLILTLVVSLANAGFALGQERSVLVRRSKVATTNSQPSAVRGLPQRPVLEIVPPAMAPRPRTPDPETTAPKTTLPLSTAPIADSLSINGVLEQVLRNAVPDNYENTKDWGKQKRRWDGLHISRDGFQIKTKRRYKMVNDGTWKKYNIRFVNPQDELHLDIVNVRAVGESRVVCEVHLQAQLDLFARLSQWESGVQLISISIDADARVRLQMQLELAMNLDPTRLPPDIVFTPDVKYADLKLDHFRVQRVSNLKGGLAKRLGEGLRSILEEQLEAKRDKLTEKINRALTKKQDSLRLSMQELVSSQWSKFREFAPTMEETP